MSPCLPYSFLKNLDMQYEKDKRIVLTLDAGGTNLVFSAIQGYEEIVDPIILPTDGENLQKCLKNIIEGFQQVKAKLKTPPVAISFAFPGPADYPNGIIGDLTNLPGFRGGVALGLMLEDHFHLPVFINNDGDLFAYGEAIAGLLPQVNKALAQSGNPKRYKNLLGVTLGTGFGAGIVRNGELFIGDNSAGAEIWIMRNKIYPHTPVEESVSIRGIRREYAQYAKISLEEAPSPKDIFEIATGQREGHRDAAIMAYEKFGEALGDALANAITLIDGLIVIGGGLAGACPQFLSTVVKEMNRPLEWLNGEEVNRTELQVYNLEDPNDQEAFLKGSPKEILVPFSNKKRWYEPVKRVGVGISKLGTSKAVAIGAYVFALRHLDRSSTLM